MGRTIFLTVVAMIAFAANSLLARAALAGGGIDAASFTAIRMLSGALALAVMLLARGGVPGLARPPGSWRSAGLIFLYAIAFSFAYLRLGAAVGALILFGSVQGTMIAIGLARGDRPTGRELAGLAVAFAAFIYLVLPGLHAPDPAGSVLMVIAGSAWGFYSVRGRGIGDPAGATAGNFLRAAPLSIPFALYGLAAGHADGQGIVLAVLSGAITSGLGYIVWYQALPGLSTTQAATVQLTVPIIAALGAVAMLGEPLTTRLVVASLCLLGGVAFAILSKRRPAGA